MKLFGQISELVRAVLRSNGNSVTIQPKAGTASGGNVTFELPAKASGTSEILDTTTTQTISNKTIDASTTVITGATFDHGIEVDNPSSNVHGVTGNIVGTTDSQTLTNKTIENPNIDDALIAEEITTPSNPPAGRRKLYAKASGIFQLDSSGLESQLTSAAPPSLDDLTDVSIASPVAGQKIQYNGTNWVNISDTLDSASDVSITTPVATQVLQYDGANWVNASRVDTLDELADVVITAAATNDVLQYNGTNWVDFPLSIDQLSDVTITAPAAESRLVYRSGQWINEPVTKQSFTITSTFSSTSTSYVTIPSTGLYNFGININTRGRPAAVSFDAATDATGIALSTAAAGLQVATLDFKIRRDGSDISFGSYRGYINGPGIIRVPMSIMNFVDTDATGTHTYDVQVKVNAATISMTFTSVRMRVVIL